MVNRAEIGIIGGSGLYNMPGLDKTREVRVSTPFGKPSDVYVVDNVILPGGNTGWHTHPGPSVVSVKSGTATVYMGDDGSCTPATHPAGTGFVEQTGHVHIVRNEGSTPLELVAFQIVPTGAARRQDVADPGFCPF